MSDDEDDYVAFGVSLKPLEEGDTIRKKAIAVEEQTVRWNPTSGEMGYGVKGIQRFHGAFTGGFSAGHFNTVNTPQGWYPKQFKSSREKKEERKQQSVEDFMDDEDRGEYGFAAQSLKTKSNFQRVAGAAQEEEVGRSRRVEGVLNTGGYIEQLVKPVSSSLGERLLSRQGWKPGQGIGPKINKEARRSRIASQVRTYGCAARPGQQAAGEEEEEDPFMEKYKDFLFAPDEIPMYVARPKENFFGIGYSGLGQSEDARNAMMTSSRPGGAGAKVRGNLKFGGGGSGKKFSISGEAFGIGADEEDDDMDVYNHGSMAQYDFSLDLLGEEKRERREAKGSRWNDAGEKSGDKENIPGFAPANSKSMIKKHFPSARPPHDWRPKRNPAQQRRSRFSPATADPAVPPARKSRWDETSGRKPPNSNPSVDERRSKLFPDECNKPKPAPSSVSATVSTEEDCKPPTLPEFLQNFKPDAGNSLASFKPFARDSAKQNRYDQYLVCIQNNRRDALKLLQPKTMTDWEKEREKVEFERASMLFKPMKGVIGSRFVSAGASEDADDSKVISPETEAENQLRKAADMKMFGQLTRTSEDWHPARLVCVRFNVPHPYGDYSQVGTKGKAKKETGVSNVFAMLENANDDDTVAKNNSVKSKESDSDIKVDSNCQDIKVEISDIKREEEEEENEAVKPPADLFKAIFLDSDTDDNDEESEEEENEVNGKESVPATAVLLPKIIPSQAGASKPWEEKEGNVLRSKEPARGIFANIDLDSLNKRAAPSSSEQEVSSSDSTEKPKKGSTPAATPPKAKAGGKVSVMSQAVRTVLGIRSEAADSSSEDEYGPRLPDSMVPQPSILISSDSEDTAWVDKSKKSKKKKEKKHKEKKSHKKKKKKQSSRSMSRSRSPTRDEHYKHKKRKRSYSRSN